MAKYIFVTVGMDITRKSVTGPGSSLYRNRKVQPIELPEDASDDAKLEAWLAAMDEAGLQPPKRIPWTVDEQGRLIVFSRKIAQSGLIPEALWAGFVFVPKAE